MNPFQSVTFTWWEVGLLMFWILALGLAIGSMWLAVFVRWRDMLLVLFVGPAFYVTSKSRTGTNRRVSPRRLTGSDTAESQSASRRRTSTGSRGLALHRSNKW